ncbi:hypothetical protein EW145_g5723 [Phellinidium pouzarii]|uniref:Uncharacterized protein n=1 Tax=Phellinidium pouzarii TaxID=167371 RepID=A0A4S4KZ20_9AGAM|nr:hypothetical protein EW145_g5723 [Phellinidium pouzarii]
MPAYHTRINHYIEQNCDNFLRAPPHILQQPSENSNLWFRRLVANEEIYPSVLCELERHQNGQLTNFVVIRSYMAKIQEVVTRIGEDLQETCIRLNNIDTSLTLLASLNADSANADSAIEHDILPLLSYYCFDSGITGDGSSQTPFNLQSPSQMTDKAHSTLSRTASIPCTDSPEPLPVPPISSQRGIPSTRLTR